MDGQMIKQTASIKEGVKWMDDRQMDGINK